MQRERLFKSLSKAVGCGVTDSLEVRPLAADAAGELARDALAHGQLIVTRAS